LSKNTVQELRLLGYFRMLRTIDRAALIDMARQWVELRPAVKRGEIKRVSGKRTTKNRAGSGADATPTD
jgi:hypothetical protein